MLTDVGPDEPFNFLLSPASPIAWFRQDWETFLRHFDVSCWFYAGIDLLSDPMLSQVMQTLSILEHGSFQ